LCQKVENGFHNFLIKYPLRAISLRIRFRHAGEIRLAVFPVYEKNDCKTLPRLSKNRSKYGKKGDRNIGYQHKTLMTNFHLNIKHIAQQINNNSGSS